LGDGEKKHREHKDYELEAEGSKADEEADEDEDEEEEEDEDKSLEIKPNKQKRKKMISSDSEEYESSEEIDDEIVFGYSEEILNKKTKPQLKDLVLDMTKREGKSYNFPLGKKGYRTKQQLVNLITTCQGKPKSKKDKFIYYTEDELYGFKLGELKEHIEKMTSRNKDVYKFALNKFGKEDLINLVLDCQGKPSKQKGGGKKFKGHGWGFMF
jgi:hypothetical protein